MWTMEKFTMDKLESIAELAQEHYGSENDIASVEYLRHEYFKNPAGNVQMRIAWNDEKKEAAGQYAAIPIWLKIGHVKKKCLMSVNTLTREEYRGQGIFKTLAAEVYGQAAEEGYTLAYGMPNQNSYPGFLKHLDFKDLGNIPLYVKPVNISNMMDSYLHSRLSAFLTKPFNVFFKIRKRSIQDVRIIKLTDKNLYLADVFWKAVRDKYRVMINRDSVYMKFRFLDIPRRQYICLYAVKHGMPAAYAVGRVMEVANIHCGMIADFLYVNGYEAEADCLLRKLMHVLGKKGADMMGCMVPQSSSEAELLKKMGFIRCPKYLEPQPFRLICRVFDDEFGKKNGIGRLRNWFFTMGDYDVV